MFGINFETTEFQDEVYAAVQTIVSGEVVTYGDIAAIMGRDPAKNGRAVGAAMLPLTSEHWGFVPWHRVVNGNGQMVGAESDVEGMARWAEKLRSEGIDVQQIGPDYFVTKIARGEYTPRPRGTAKKPTVERKVEKTVPCERHYRDGAPNDGAQQMCRNCY